MKICNGVNVKILFSTDTGSFWARKNENPVQIYLLKHRDFQAFGNKLVVV